MRSKNTLTKQQQPTRLQRMQGMPKHPFIIPVITFLVMFVFSAIAFINMNAQTIGPSDSRVVKLYVDGEEQTIPTRAKTVKDLLERAKVTVGEHDVVEPALDSAITDDDYNVNIYRAQPVTIIDEDEKQPQTTYSAQKAPEDIVKQAGVKVYPEDKVEVRPPDNVLKDGIISQKVVINRATPIKLNLYGTTYDVRTHANTVAEVMKERGLNFDNESVLPSPDTQLKKDEVVFVTHPGRQVAMVEEAIPQAEETKNDPNLQLGQTQVVSEGNAGKKVVVYEIAADGSRKPMQEIIIALPVSKIVAKGTKVLNIAIAGDKSALLSQAGVPASQHYAADFVISRESGWRLGAQNAGGCLGLGQACPGQKLVNACPDWQTNAVCQIQFFTGYANGRYGGWQGAYETWLLQHWW